VTKVLLSRLKFGVTMTYHFLFVPLTIGLALLVAVMQVLAYTHKVEAWERLSRFFGTLYSINFAVRVITGSSGVPVRHELVDVHRAVAVRPQPAAPAGAHDLDLRGQQTGC
jgi:cytochrome bd-type quinol oxidase subunit 1